MLVHMINIHSYKGFKKEKLVSFCDKIDHKLPRDYVDFLQLHNGGLVENCIGIYSNGLKRKTFMISSMFGLNVNVDDDLSTQLDVYRGRIPNNCIPVGRDAGGNLICLDLSKDGYGQVYFWNHEEEFEEEDAGTMTTAHLYHIAPSFDEYLNMIESETEYKSDDKDKNAEVWIDPEFLKKMKHEGYM